MRQKNQVGREPDFSIMVWLFTICSFLGVVIETVFCFVFGGYLQSRTGMLLGPFNQIYGFAAVLLLLLLYRSRGRGRLHLFVVSALAGGAFEYLASLAQERCLGSVSWDYHWLPFNLFGRTNLLYMLFFGLLGVAFMEWIYPALEGLLRRVGAKRLLTGAVAVFMAANLLVSARVVLRWSARCEGVPPADEAEQLIDRYYPDDVLQLIYPTMKFVD